MALRIYLVGFMGSGKSTWGSVWADVQGWKFIDLDLEIERKYGMSVYQIFHTRGEHAFRIMEAEMLRATEKFRNAIIACGGGTPCFHQNMEWMNEKGYTVFLKASEDMLFGRLVLEKQQRPLIANIADHDLRQVISLKLKERAYFYHQSKWTLDANNLDVDSLNDIVHSAI
jgi:shikimate kinase